MLSPHSTCLDAFYASEPSSGSKSYVAANRALSLRPVQTSVLHIAKGRVWVTVGEGVQPRDAGYGDCFLEAGDELEVLAGQRVVFESLDKTNPVYFNFSPLNVDLAGVNAALDATYLGVKMTSPAALYIASQVQGGVAQPWHDLRLALGLASSALARLAVGLTWGSALRLGRLGQELRANISHFLLRYSHE